MITELFLGQAFVTVSKMPPGMPALYIVEPGSKPNSASDSSFLLLNTGGEEKS